MEGRGVPYRVVDVAREGVPLGAAGFTGIVSMGGPMSVNDAADDMEKEKRLLLEGRDRGLPMLGICLGAQLIASALGSRVYPGQGPEVGWGDVTLTERGLEDPLFAGVGNPMPVLHWHGETYDLPEGGVRLAFSGQYEQQAFRVGDRIYGLQFHLEADGEMVREWVLKDGESHDGLLADPAAVLEGIKPNLDRVRFSGALVFGRFLDLVAGRRSG